MRQKRMVKQLTLLGVRREPAEAIASDLDLSLSISARSLPFPGLRVSVLCVMEVHG
jgi:hypothetical protein